MNKLILSLALVSTTVFGLDLQRGERKYKEVCANCHHQGLDGRTGFPNLAGQNPSYITNQLFAFQKGTRKHRPMEEISKTMSREEIMDVAFYLSTLGCKK